MPQIPYIPIQDGEEATNQLFNTRFQAIHDAINSGLDGTNLADNSVNTNEIVDRAVTASKIEVQEAWKRPTLSNGWLQYTSIDAAWGEIEYMKDSLGFVHIKGLMRAGTLDAVAFTLPVGYRPIKQELFPTNTSGGIGRVDIHPNGSVIPRGGTNAHFSLSAVIFRAEQ